MTTRRPLGGVIQQRRTELGKTRSALSRDTGISLSYLKEIENNRPSASERLLRILARSLGCKLDDISQSLDQHDAA